MDDDYPVFERRYIQGGRGGGKAITYAIGMILAFSQGKKVFWWTPKYHEELANLEEVKTCAEKHKDAQLDAIAYAITYMLEDIHNG